MKQLSDKVAVGQIIVSKDSLKKDRDKTDFYETDPRLPTALYLSSLFPYHMDKELVLDVGMGTGIWGKTFVDVYGRPGQYCDYILDTVEIDQERFGKEVYTQWYGTIYWGDFRDPDLIGRKYNWIIGNPPFKYATEFVRRAHELINPGGHIIFLLPTNFRNTVERYKLFVRDGLMPSEVFDSSDRVSFTGDNKTYPGEYAVYHWEVIPGVTRGYYIGKPLKWR